MAYQSLVTILCFGSAACLSSITSAQVTLVWETTVSVTSELEGADDMVVDAAGNAIVTGYLPVEGDFFVLKFDPAGDLEWSRIIGGTGLDWVNGLAVDDGGDIYLAGRSLSPDFPTMMAYQPSMNGTSDAILLKLAGESGETIFSTFFGGAGSEWAQDVAIGPDGTITIAGQTDSIDLPTVNPIQAQLTLIDCFCHDVFVARFSPDGDALVFGTYLGGTYDDVADDVTIDAAGITTIAGRTKSDDFPTLNAVQPSHGGGEYDAFVARIDADDSLVFSTFLGGEEWEIVQGMAVDGAGAVYVTGSTRSIEFPTTPGAFQDVFVGGILACEVLFSADFNCFDMFVTKFGTDGSYQYSTFIGGHADDEPRNVVVDSAGRAHVIGYTYSNDFPLDAPFGHVVTMRLNAEGSDLDYMIAHWTPGSNAGSAVALYGNDLFIATSVGLPYDAYVARYNVPGEDGVSDPPETCLSPPGDLTGDSATDVVDVQCGLVTALFVLSGMQGAAPGCLAVSIQSADVDCDMVFNVNDVLLLIYHALGAPLSPSMDADGDGCVDACTAGG